MPAPLPRSAAWPPAVAAAVLCLCLLRVAPWQTVDPDTLSRLAVGRHLAQHGIPATDPFGVVNAHSPWSNPEWLGDLLLFQVWQAAGEPGLVAFKLILLCLGWLLAFQLARTPTTDNLLNIKSFLGFRRQPGGRSIGDASPWIALGLLLLLIPGSLARFTERNHLHLLWLVPLYGLVLQRGHRSPRRLWPLVPLGLLWPNLHGSFPLAWLLLGAALVRAVASAQPRRPTIAALAMLLLLHPLAVLASPFGFRSYGRVWDHIQGWSIYSDLLIEWQPLAASASAHARLGTLALGLLGLAAAVAWWRNRPHGSAIRVPRPDLVVLFVVTTALAAASQRFVLLAAMTAAPALTRALTAMSQDRARWLGPSVALLGLVLLIPLLAVAPLAHHGSVFTRDTAPLAAAAALARIPDQPSTTAGDNPRQADHQPRVHAPYLCGPWLLWLVPGVRLAIDPRNTAGHRHLERFVRARRHRPAQVLADIDRHHITAVLLGFGKADGLVARRLNRDRRWQMVHTDPHYQVFRRRPKSAQVLDNTNKK